MIKNPHKALQAVPLTGEEVAQIRSGLLEAIIRWENKPVRMPVDAWRRLREILYGYAVSPPEVNTIDH